MSWRRLSQQGAFATTIVEGGDEHMNSSSISGGIHGHSSSRADAYSGNGGSSLAQDLSHRRPRVSTDSSVLLSEPEDDAGGSPGASAGIQAAHSQAPETPQPAGASFSDINLRDIRLYRMEDGRPVLLGKGTYAKVYKGQLKGEDVAVKVWPLNEGMQEQAEANFKAEVLLMRMCKHRNVVGFRGASVTPRRLLMVMELCPGGDLKKALRADSTGRYLWYTRNANADGSRREGEGHMLALDIARGLAFLHAMQIIHFDLKTPNVLLGADGAAKIGDVGMARFMPQDYLTSTAAAGTLAWAAPELLLGERCSQRADMYSLGVILWELCTGESPAGRRLRPLRVPDDCPPAVRDIVHQCLERDPAARPRAAEVAALLGGDAALLQQPLQPRACAQGAPQIETPELAVCALHRALAVEVYGSEDDARAAGCMPLDPETALAAMDLRLFCGYIAAMREVLPDPAAAFPTPEGRSRAERLVAAWRAYIMPFLQLRTRVIIRNRLTNLEAGAGPKADDLPKAGDAAAGDAKLEGDGKHSRRLRSDSAAEEVVMLQHRLRPVIAAINFTPDQRAAFLREWRHTTEALERNQAERAGWTEALQRLAQGSVGGYNEAVAASMALKENSEQRAALANGFQGWFTTQLLSLEQQGRAELACFPHPPDGLSLGVALAAQDEV